MESTLANVDLGRYRRLVQMFWDPEPSNDTVLDQPIWCLGRSYKLGDQKAPKILAESVQSTPEPKSSTTTTPGHNESLPPIALGGTETTPQSTEDSFSSSLAYDEAYQQGSWPSAFLDDFESRFWMTYRSDFELIPRSSDPKAISSLSLTMRIKTQFGDQAGFSSDSGWGCMIRSGQSLLANATALLRLGRDWRRGSLPDEEREIIRLFADDSRAPYSIHSFVEHGASACGKYPGEWFGPSATARCIQSLVDSNDPQLRVYATSDGPDVYEDRFMKIAKGDGNQFHPTLILIGTRLGIDKITPVYWEALIASLQMPQSVGIAGGRPASAHYFAGAQGSFLFYLDPHHTRPALPYHADFKEYTDEEINSCHTNRLRRIHVREMDPSMLIGFLIKSEDDWQDWRRGIKHVQGKSIIYVSDRDPTLGGKHGTEGRDGAIDEVETLSDDDGDTIV